MLLRTEVGKNLNTRLTPSLEFILDAIPENADHIAALLQEARERDEAVAGLAATAQYAGDSDPYVKPREFDEDDVAEDEDEDEDVTPAPTSTPLSARPAPTLPDPTPDAAETTARTEPIPFARSSRVGSGGMGGFGAETHRGSASMPSDASASPSAMSESIARSRCRLSGQPMMTSSSRTGSGAASRSALRTAPRACRSLPS